MSSITSTAGTVVNEKKKRKPRRESFVNWRRCPGRAILLADLEPGGILDGHENLDEKFLFDFYKQYPEFEEVCFLQFKDRLKDHRGQSGRDRQLAKRDEEAMRQDLLVHPKEEKDSAGKYNYNNHPAKRLLRMDVANGLHNQLGPSGLRAKRPAYDDFTDEDFKFKIYQEKRRVKFINHLQQTREKQRPPRSFTLSKEDLDTRITEHADAS